jgi:beta-xylosidase
MRLPCLPDWAASHRNLTWAPAVLPWQGRYVLYYTARYTRLGLQTISRAMSSRPDGPFHDDSSRPLICQSDLGGAIDPSPYVDVDGKAYLVWKNDGNAFSRQTCLWIQPLSEDGLSLVGEPCELIRRDRTWEGGVIEAPAMVHWDGWYYLFYSANGWATCEYAMGYAVGPTPLGPSARPLKKPWFSSQGCVQGPGGADFFRDGSGKLWMAYHAWTAPLVGYPWGKRSLRIEAVFFQEGEPATNGPDDGQQLVERA